LGDDNIQFFIARFLHAFLNKFGNSIVVGDELNFGLIALDYCRCSSTTSEAIVSLLNNFKGFVALGRQSVGKYCLDNIIGKFPL